MSPLAAPPSRGYPDYQRIVNADTDFLFQDSTFHPSGQLLSTVLNVSRFAYLMIRAGITVAPVTFTAQWWLDAAATHLIGKRTFQLDTNITGTGCHRLTNLGGFVQLEWDAGLGINFTSDIVVGASNNGGALEFIPSVPVLVDQQATAIGAGASVTVYPADYYAGPMSVWYDPQYAAGSLVLEVLNTAFAWDIVDQFSHTATGNYRLVMVTPPGAWRLRPSNTTAGASTFYLNAVPSTTGAS